MRRNNNLQLRLEQALASIDGLACTMKLYLERHDADTARIGFWKAECDKLRAELAARSAGTRDFTRIQAEIASRDRRPKKRKRAR